MFSSGAHILIFPYPAQGHIIPLLDLTHKLLTHNLTVTVLVTPSHLPTLQPLLSSHPHSLHPLVLSPPPYSIHLGPVSTTIALSKLSGPIRDWFKSHASPPTAIISDMFLGWTQDLASTLGLPRVVFWSLGAYATSIFNCLWHDLPQPDDPTDQNSVLLFEKVPGSPKYPWREISDLYRDYKRDNPDWEYFRISLLANDRSYGVVFNSFPELEGVYIDHFKKEIGHDKIWAVGPLIPDSNGSAVMSNELRDWLDSKKEDEVVYVCFGSLWSLTGRQISALATALENSVVSFVWVLKGPDMGHMSEDGAPILDGFEERVGGRGVLVKGWAPQKEILRHKAVGAFLTHCGWNSVLEGIRAGVLLLTWPLLADQFYNAKLLVEDIGIGVRFCEGGREVVPDSAELTRLLDESVCRDFRVAERERVKMLGKVASEASKGGDLEVFVGELSRLNDA